MAIKRLGLLFAVLLCFASCEDTTIIEYSYPDGITEISIDASGNIWFGTKNFGVVFYNGSKWKNYRNKNSAMPNDFIFSIDFDSKNNAWIATNGGLVKFDGKNFFTFNTTGTSLDTLITSCAAVDKNDNVWVGTYGYGVWYYNGTEWKSFRSLNPDLNMITDIAVDRNGDVWVINNNGIFKYFENNLVPAYSSADYGHPDISLNKIVFSRLNEILLASTYGVSYQKDGSWVIIDSTANILPNKNITAICIDSADGKWIGTSFKGLANFDGITWKYYDKTNSGIPSNEISALATDKAGNIWIGTKGRQVCRFDGKNWKTIDIYDF